MKKLYTFLVKNWKTTISAIILLLLTYHYHIGAITSEQFELYSGILIALGFLFSKDADKTGINKTETVETYASTEGVRPPDKALEPKK
ncbi:MAG: hypothetical protein LBM02_10075 [Lachnospiraceae bacterium]|jgi:hypothetical protein|nr:hypothetical protein [Lachnospiraceae bacterium]